MDINDIKARLKQLREEVARAHEDTKVTLEEARTKDESGNAPGLTGVILERYTNADDVIGAGEAEIDALERQLKAVRADNEIVEQREDETGKPQERHNEAFRNFLRVERQSELSLEDRKILRAQSVGTDSEGGFTVPEGFWARISEAKLAFGSLQGVANVISTGTGNDLPWVTNDDTGNEGVLLAENTAETDLDLVFGERQLGAYKFGSRSIRVPVELMQDSAFDIEAYIVRKLAERIARVENRLQTVGTGTAQPEGIINGLTANVTAATVIPTENELIDLVYGLDPAYMTGREAFSFNHATAGVMRKVVDGNGNKAWQPSLQQGQPSTLLGFPTVTNQNMPNFTSGNLAVLFGDHFEAFVIRNVKAASIRRLDERYAEFHQVGFLGFSRMDSLQDNIGAIRSMDVT